ncbi:MAG: hypothetical protein R3F56_00645 [Planctomycetota bacterium]
MKSTALLVCLAASFALRSQSPPADPDQRLELRPLRLRIADRVLPGVLERGGVGDDGLDLRDLRAHVTFGPDAALGASSVQPLWLVLEVRTTRAEFGTVLMCRQRGAVHYSFTMGRRPGRVAFEPWSWTQDKLLSRQRLDDGKWHVLEAAFDPASRRAALRVDGVVDVVQELHGSFAGGGEPALRLGHNLDPGVNQPFGGEVRRFERRGGVPRWLTAALEAERACRVLARDDSERALSAWLARARRARPPRAASATDWQRQAAAIRARVQDALGLWPPPYASGGELLAGKPTPLTGATDAHATDFGRFAPSLPLDVREGGTLVRDAHTVTRLYWQTFAGYYASGYLYRPRPQPEGRGPAMLCPHGHWQDGARHPVVQARCIAFAQQGYVVLAVDSIHLYDDRIGLSPLSVMTWNNLRGLELLRGRPDVDPARIGCTGASGGGQQTYYLTALETGLAAAAPAVMACHFEDILSETGVHCACNHTPHLVRAADMPEMAAAFAPRPQFFLTVSGDWTARFQEHGFPAIADVYRLMGGRRRSPDVAPDLHRTETAEHGLDPAEAVRCQRWDKGHAYDREMRQAAYGFFARALAVPGAGDFREPEAGIGTEELQILAALDDAGVARDPRPIVAEFHTRLSAPRGDRPDRVEARLRALLEHDEEPVRGAPRCVGTTSTARGKLERWAVPTDGDLSLPVVVRRAEGDPTGPPRVALVLADAGKAAVLEREADFVDALLAAGVHVAVADVRYVGELDLGRAWRDLYGRFFGLDEGVLAVRDARRLVAALPALGFAEPRVGLWGLGDRGAVALMAAALEPGVVAAAPEPGPNYREANRTPALSRVLLHADLDDVQSVLGARGLVGAAATPSGLAAALAR